MKVLVDTDPGTDVDDALALAYLARHTECELLGVTIVTGVPEERGAIAEVSLRAGGREDVPIHLGSAEPIGGKGQPLCQQYEAIRDVPHRMDRLGDTARGFLRETILAHPGEITLLTIGALTNVAHLVAGDPTILTKLREHVLMFGRFGPGVPEWNVVVDVEAGRRVLAAPSAPRRFVGLDVTERCRMSGEEAEVLLAGERYAPLRAMSRRFLRDAGSVIFHDPLAAAAIFAPELCSWRSGAVAVRPDGATTLASRGPDRVAADVDTKGFFEHFSQVLHM